MEFEDGPAFNIGFHSSTAVVVTLGDCCLFRSRTGLQERPLGVGRDIYFMAELSCVHARDESEKCSSPGEYQLGQTRRHFMFGPWKRAQIPAPVSFWYAGAGSAKHNPPAPASGKPPSGSA